MQTRDTAITVGRARRSPGGLMHLYTQNKQINKINKHSVVVVVVVVFVVVVA